MALKIYPKTLNITVYCLSHILINWNFFLFDNLVRIQISHITKLSPEYTHNLLKELYIELKEADTSWNTKAMRKGDISRVGSFELVQ